MSDRDKTIEIEMPQLGSGDAEADAAGATLASWLVSVGDEVEAGEVIAELETDKATVELESPAAGRIATLDVAAGTEDIHPGTVLGTIEGDGAPVDDAAAADDDAAAGAASEAETEAGSEAEAAAEAEAEAATGTRGGKDAAPDSAGEDDSARAPGVSRGFDAGPPPTPLARRAAADAGVDLDAVVGSGAGGRIVEADVRRAAASPTADVEAPAREVEPAPTPARGVAAPVEADLDAADFRTERLSAMRKTIARRMTESKQTVPHFYLRVRVDLDPLLEVRARLNASLADAGDETKISVNDFVVRAIALALRDVPAANVQYAEDGMRVFDRVDVSVAVATEGGLVTPVVRHADGLGLAAIAAETRRLASLARAGKLQPDQYRGGTVTVSNLGMYGIDTVYPILNPPQACILGVGAASEEPVVRDGAIVIGRRAAFTLAADHRAVDGAVGAELMAALRTRLEDPLGMVL